MNTHAPFDGTLPDGWNGGAPVTKFWNGEYIHLYRVTRPCATCSTEISIDVTKKALLGEARNAGLLLRNCPTCRKERKSGGPGSRGGTSRPTAEPIGLVVGAPADDALQMANNVMRDELTGLYAQIQVLKARLATYELQFGMQILGSGKREEPATDPLLAKAKARLPNGAENNFPWGLTGSKT